MRRLCLEGLVRPPRSAPPACRQVAQVAASAQSLVALTCRARCKATARRLATRPKITHCGAALGEATAGAHTGKDVRVPAM